jgi:hypothetical protein
MKISFRFGSEKTVITPGIYWGPKPIENMLSVGGYGLWKVHGHTGWSGRGEVSYYPTEYMLVRLEDDFATTLLCVEPGHKWKVVRKAMQEMVFAMGGD